MIHDRVNLLLQEVKFLEVYSKRRSEYREATNILITIRLQLEKLDGLVFVLESQLDEEKKVKPENFWAKSVFAMRLSISEDDDIEIIKWDNVAEQFFIKYNNINYTMGIEGDVERID